MNRSLIFSRVLVALSCFFSFFSAATGDRYRVTLLTTNDESPSTAKRLAAAYHGQLETPVGNDGTLALSSATASLLSHDPLVAQIQRIDTSGADVTPSAATAWSLGTYEYDGAGNIRRVGSSIFVYDSESRLSYEEAGTQNRQALTFDGFGNIRAITEGNKFRIIGANASSNRIDIPSKALNNLAMDENTPAIVKASMYATGGLTALGAAGFAGGSGGGLAAGAFRLPPIARGNFIETALATAFGGGLPRTFPVIDRFLNGVATSVKSLDLASKTHQDVARLTSTLTGFVDKLAQFNGGRLGNVQVQGSAIAQRVLEVVVQRGAATPQQIQALQRAAT